MHALTQVLRAAATAVGAMLLATAALANYPDKPIKLIVPYAQEALPIIWRARWPMALAASSSKPSSWIAALAPER